MDNLEKRVGKIKGISLFSSAGIAELLFNELDIEIVLANELLEKRAKFYKDYHENKNIIVGDIRDKKVKDEIYKYLGQDIEFLMATPPCQGVSNLGKNKSQEAMIEDDRNFLIFDVMEIIDKFDFKYILIENVPRYQKMYFPYKKKHLLLEDILKKKYGGKYEIDIKVLNSKDYGVPQNRERAIIKIYKKGLKWEDPIKEPEINLKKAIGKLPTLESGETSKIKYHYAKKHNPRHILWLKHTPTGKTALNNEVYYPKKEDGTKIKGFATTYKRIEWDKPAPTITMANGSVSSQNNVHPGRAKEDGTYSDARVLTLLELFIVSSIPLSIEIDLEKYSENFIRHIIGEGVPPLMMKKIIQKIPEMEAK